MRALELSWSEESQLATLLQDTRAEKAEHEDEDVMQVREPHRGPELSGQIASWLDHGGPFPEFLTVLLSGADGRITELTYEILGRDERGCVTTQRGKKGFVLQVRDPQTEKRLAAKLCIAADYEHHSPRDEAELASRLQGGGEDLFLLPRQVGRVKTLNGQPEGDARAWVCFVADWLDGETLEQIIESTPERITPGLVVQIAEALIKAVLLLDRRELKHDDLHLGNLMLVPTSVDLLAIDSELPAHSLKVIDMGSLKDKRKPTSKPDDDWSMLAKCLAHLHNLLFKDRGTASRHPQFLRRLREYIEALSDEEPGRHFPDPSSYIQKLRDIADSLTVLPAGQPKFHPFDAISAEHLANDRLLLNLFVNHLPWIELVQNAEPTVLIGPRGCGKSMVFRYMGLRTHLTSSDAREVLERLGFFGVYIGCASDLGNDLLWIARERGRPERWAASITTYFNLVLARELLRSLAASASVESVANDLKLTNRAKVLIASYVQEQLEGELDIIRLRGMDPLQTCADLLDRLRLRLGRDLADGRQPNYQLPTTFIRDLCQHVIDVAGGFATYRIVFLLDDYTAHRLSPAVQSILNAVLWQRSNTHVFKVSSEPHGFNPTHVDGARIDAHREFVPVDAGQSTISSEDYKGRQRFITYLVDKRLQAAGFAGNAKQLIGPSKFPTDPALAQEIRTKRQGQRTYYHGLEVISNAWSGDAATILHMLREMFVTSGVTEETTTLIGQSVQHRAIVKVSTALRERVLGYHPFGEEMAKVLNAFGELCRRLLVDAPEQTNRKGEISINRRYRIEMTLPPGVELEAALRSQVHGETAVKLMHELVRRAVFIELPPSRGKEDAARRTLRWQLRSSFLPSFGASLIRESYIDVKKLSDFVDLLTAPEQFMKATYDRYSRAIPSAPDLFRDLGPVEEAE